ncbi:sensor histidine kinase [Croceibacterium aestuarii]|uniref:sensor histidine kinase n=1 Tax=Croceibacterium aestuarii TaxID=3064139 RepID=UPI00272E102B|nr:PAS domain S-box protein [Croceibacterium sp. D39]
MPETASGLKALIEQTPAMLWRGDQNGRCVFLNRAQREFWGVEDPVLDAFDWSSTLLAEDRELVFGPFQEGMANRQAFTCEARYRRADGAIRVLRTNAAPYFKEGVFLGMIGVNQDVTDLKDIQADLDTRNRELAGSLRLANAATRRFELASRISGLAMSEHDRTLRYTWAHNLPDACLGKTPAEFVGGELGARVEAILKGVLETGEPAATEIDFTVEGQRRWWEIQACRTEAGGDEPRVIASALDVTARKLNEDKLEVLARELAHRVKNIYSVTQAIIQQSARTADVDPDFVRSVSERLATLAHAQDSLLASPNDRVSVKSIAEANLRHLSAVDVSGDEATLPGRSAPYLALALHELGTNSLKYGALAQAEGKVELAWQVDRAGDLRIAWVEHSPTPPAASDKEGFGTALLTRIFAGATGGRVERELTPSGLRWSAVIPTAPDLQVGDQSAQADQVT